MPSLGQTIYLWRLERGLTQDELSSRTGISRPNLSAIEKGVRDVTVGTVRRLALALEINPGILVDGISPVSKRAGGLTRRQLDRIAHWVVGKKITLSDREKELGEAIRPLLKGKLQHGIRYGRSLPRTARQEVKYLRQVKALISPSELNNLLSRIHKLSGGFS